MRILIGGHGEQPPTTAVSSSVAASVAVAAVLLVERSVPRIHPPGSIQPPLAEAADDEIVGRFETKIKSEHHEDRTQPSAHSVDPRPRLGRVVRREGGTQHLVRPGCGVDIVSIRSRPRQPKMVDDGSTTRTNTARTRKLWNCIYYFDF